MQLAEHRRRSRLAFAATLTAAGIAVSAGNQDLGAWLTLAGLFGLVLGLHYFGRLGPEKPQSPR